MSKSDAKFAGTKLRVDDLEKMASFYKAVCGLTEVTRVVGMIGGRETNEILMNFRGEGQPTFVLRRFVDDPKPTQDGTVNVFITEDLSAFVERALRHGATIVQEPYVNPDHHIKVVFIADLEGHLMEVVELI
jgi:lactoylglutathione lyase